MTVTDVIKSARARLGDTDGTGWDNTRLLDLVNAGQRDLCRRASVYRHKVYMDLANGIPIYTLPDDCYNITRVEIGNKQLPIYSREDFDNVKVASSIFAIKSNLNRSQIEIYPTPEDISTFDKYLIGTEIPDAMDLVSPEGVVTGASAPILLSPDLGVTTGIHDLTSCNKPSDFGELSDIGINTSLRSLDLGMGVLVHLPVQQVYGASYGFLESVGTEHVVGTYGICTHASFGDNYITVYYDAVPPIIKWETASLYVEDLWLPALVHYVVGMARQDDNDEGNYQIGEIELKKYEQEVAKARKISAKSFNSQVGVVRETIYRRF